MKKISTYNECLNYLYGLQRFGIKFGHNNINYLLEKLNNPHKKFKSIHIGGTNGKGSTTSILGSILKECGYKVGIYTSPHLIDYNERITVNGNPISHQRVIELTNDLIEIIEDMPTKSQGHPTYFEITTAQAFQYFAEQNVDFGIIEVGMGGRLDATNVITPLLSIITNIGLEHTEMLGDTHAKIAYEKSGIIKPNVPIITGTSNIEALEVITNTSNERQSPLLVYGKNFKSKINFSNIDESNFDYFGINNDWKDLSLSLIGEHQTFNASLALSAIEILHQYKKISFDDAHIYNGLKNVQWPGRMQIFSRNPMILLDGAHNPDGAKIFADNIKKFFLNKRIYLITGILKDKDREKMLETLCPLAYEVILTTIQYERASSTDELFEIAKKFNSNIKTIPNVRDSIDYVKQKADTSDLICISGSLYIIGEALDILKKNVVT